ncbi:branched-chain amino acid ABC transporter permease [uncultured Lamprocystis sp.]|jgi:branched-chain amino acid transport system permease protein|uniref:branched-chain amino acid ABC transporter permease n=1 Tax=uncultured Lamprocystis sp. TaxID=543132 RepID=UPI0025E6EDB0|nr:branched-chain amino acid ABC transporter permease [uncultured Lamprocystis sp.]
MDVLLQQLINGLILGSLYALVALGYTMVYGILELINFAHGEIVMVGAMVSVSVLAALTAAGVPVALALPLALAAAVVVCVVTGVLVERVAYRPLRNAPRLAPLITAIGVSIVLQNLAMIFWGRQYLSFPPVIEVQVYDVLGATVSNVQILIFVVAALTMGGLLLLVNRTRLGRAMRATAQNREVAGLMGVDVNRVIAATFIVGSALAAVAGLLIASYYGIAHYNMGFILGLKAFSAAVLGGIGNIPGALLGGLLLGVIESLGAGYIGDLTGGFLGSHYQDIFAFLILILVLTFRPSGLLGERVADRA